MMVKVNVMCEIQSVTRAPKGVLREGIAPTLWADVAAAPLYGNDIRAATKGRGVQRRAVKIYKGESK